MKNILFSLFAIFMVTASSAAVKCIAMGADSNCSATYSDPTGQNLTAEPGQSDWGASCNNISIHGIALCGTNTGLSSGDVVDSVSISGDVGANTACYCKIVQPVVSRWVFAENRSTAGDCAWWCQNACAGKTIDKAGNANFHSAILGVLYE